MLCFLDPKNLDAKLVEAYSKLSTYTFIFYEHKSFSELTSPLSKGKCCEDFVLMPPFQKRVIHHLFKTSVVLQKAVPMPN